MGCAGTRDARQGSTDTEAGFARIPDSLETVLSLAYPTARPARRTARTPNNPPITRSSRSRSPARWLFRPAAIAIDELIAKSQASINASADKLSGPIENPSRSRPANSLLTLRSYAMPTAGTPSPSANAEACKGIARTRLAFFITFIRRLEWQSSSDCAESPASAKLRARACARGLSATPKARTRIKRPSVVDANRSNVSVTMPTIAASVYVLANGWSSGKHFRATPILTADPPVSHPASAPSHRRSLTCARTASQQDTIRVPSPRTVEATLVLSTSRNIKR